MLRPTCIDEITGFCTECQEMDGNTLCNEGYCKCPCHRYDPSQTAKEFVFYDKALMTRIVLLADNVNDAHDRLVKLVKNIYDWECEQ